MSSYSLNTDPMEPENPPEATDVMLVAAALVLDTAAAGVVAALSEGGVRSILLKGPATAQALYGDGAPRPYSDVDLLVAPWSGDMRARSSASSAFAVPPTSCIFGPPTRKPGTVRSTV
jgi:putative nucleotidyltransferase-like protein